METKNLELYKKLREVPSDAQRVIDGGRLRGKTDINPQWRIEKMTEVFGAIGFGWNYKVTRSELVYNEQTRETCCFVDVLRVVNFFNSKQKTLTYN